MIKKFTDLPEDVLEKFIELAEVQQENMSELDAIDWNEEILFVIAENIYLKSVIYIEEGE